MCTLNLPVGLPLSCSLYLFFIERSGLDVFTHLLPDSANDNDSAGFGSVPTHRLNDASAGRKTKRAVDAALSQLKVTEQKRS